jgi:hypothetical protein
MCVGAGYERRSPLVAGGGPQTGLESLACAVGPGEQGLGVVRVIAEWVCAMPPRWLLNAGLGGREEPAVCARSLDHGSSINLRNLGHQSESMRRHSVYTPRRTFSRLLLYKGVRRVRNVDGKKSCRGGCGPFLDSAGGTRRIFSRRGD